VGDRFVEIVVQIVLHTYKPRGRRDLGSPRKRWTADVGTGDSPIP
jgi:hypothetical protein